MNAGRFPIPHDHITVRSPANLLHNPPIAPPNEASPALQGPGALLLGCWHNLGRQVQVLPQEKHTLVRQNLQLRTFLQHD